MLTATAPENLMWDEIGRQSYSPEGSWWVLTKTIPTTHPDYEPWALIRQQILTWRALAIQENLYYSDERTHVVFMPVTGPSQGAKSTGTEAFMDGKYRYDDNQSRHAVPFSSHVLTVDTERPPRRKESESKHRHRHWPKGTISSWIIEDHKRPIGQKQLVWAGRIAYNWYAITRQELDEAMQTVRDKAGRVIPKLILFPSFPEISAIFKMLFPDITHVFGVCPALLFFGGQIPPRPDVSDEEAAWREAHTKYVIDFFRRQIISDVGYEYISSGVSLLDSLYIPVRFEEEEFNVRKVVKETALDAYKRIIGLEVATYIFTIFYLIRSGGLDRRPYFNRELERETKSGFSHIISHRQNYWDLCTAEARRIDHLAAHEIFLEPKLDLAAPVYQSQLPAYDMIYPGHRVLPTNL